MKYRGVEYRIFENGTKDAYKAEIRAGDFMGLPQWKKVVREACINQFSQTIRYYYEFKTCEEAQAAAKRQIDEPFRNQWHECKCK